jgi:hypothetical protein
MTDDPKITKRKISDYTPDARNANKGTERGQYMIDTSVESVGLARSIVAANDDTIPAGNKTLQAALDAGIEDVIEVETDGNALVVVKRTDWATVDSEKARQYAYLDNRASEVGLQWDAEQVLRDLDAGVDLSGMFHDWELDKVLGKLQDGEFDPMAEWDGMPEFESEDLKPIHSIKVNFKSFDDLKAFAVEVNYRYTQYVVP